MSNPRNYTLKYAKAQEFWGYDSPGAALTAAADWSNTHRDSVYQVNLPVPPDGPAISPPTTRRIVANEYNEPDYRSMGLRESVMYFAYVRRNDPAPPTATVVLEMAGHFAEWIATGTMPIRETE